MTRTTRPISVPSRTTSAPRRGLLPRPRPSRPPPHINPTRPLPHHRHTRLHHFLEGGKPPPIRKRIRRPVQNPHDQTPGRHFQNLPMGRRRPPPSCFQWIEGGLRRPETYLPSQLRPR